MPDASHMVPRLMLWKMSTGDRRYLRIPERDSVLPDDQAPGPLEPSRQAAAELAAQFFLAGNIS